MERADERRGRGHRNCNVRAEMRSVAAERRRRHLSERINLHARLWPDRRCAGTAVDAFNGARVYRFIRIALARRMRPYLSAARRNGFTRQLQSPRLRTAAPNNVERDVHRDGI